MNEINENTKKETHQKKFLIIQKKKLKKGTKEPQNKKKFYLRASYFVAIYVIALIMVLLI